MASSIMDNLNVGAITGKNENSASTDAKIAAIKKALAGDNYSYIAATMGPSELGVGTDPQDIKTNINAIFDYTQLLINGDGPANRIEATYGSNIPIGDRYLVNTGGQCKPVIASVNCQMNGTCEPRGPEVGTDVETADGKIKVVPRSMVIDNIPEYDVPIPPSIAAEAGGVKRFDGIVPGILSDVMKLNPMGIMTSFLLPGYPDCIETRINSVTGKGANAYRLVPQTGFIITSEAQSLNPCIFTDNINPLTGERCPGGEVEGFSNINSKKFNEPKKIVMPNDKAVKLYMILISLLGSYLLYKLLFKK